MSSIRFRNANRDDLDDILLFIKKLAKYEKLEDQVKATRQLLDINIFTNKHAEVLMLEEEDRKIGFALYYYGFSTFEAKPSLYLEDLYILENERQKGYGKEALKYLANIALDNGCARFEWSCLNWNKNAIDFYLKFGALPQNEWTLFRLEGDRLVGYKK